jgi:hypothetical protein
MACVAGRSRRGPEAGGLTATTEAAAATGIYCETWFTSTTLAVREGTRQPLPA